MEEKMKRPILQTLVICCLLLVTLLTACTTATPAASAGSAALTITGLVEKELSLTMDALKAMEVVKINVEHPQKGPQTGEGVRLNALLDQANPKAEAKTLVFTTADNYTAEASLADARKCVACLVAFNQAGNLKTMMPGMESSLWVKDVIKIEVK
jgi:hypothetical protein